MHKGVGGLIPPQDVFDLVLMQDNAGPHAARETMEEFEARGIPMIKWPPFSPDLNPIETLWNKMKDWIHEQYGLDENNLSYDRLRQVVEEAWKAIPQEVLEDLLLDMPTRCALVIAANGGHIDR
jgi:hypothetical protein